MKEAIVLVQSGMSIRKAAIEKGLAFKTLSRYVKKYKEDNEARLVPNYSVNKIFTTDEEKILAEYIVNCSKMFYGLSLADCRYLAYETAIINKKVVPQNWIKNQSAGMEWMRHFRKRNPILSLWTPEGCSLSRATSFNRHNVALFFNNLSAVLKRSDTSFLNGSRIYNLDETSTMTVQKPQKVLAEKGIKQVGKVTSAERGHLVTTCCIISATGQYIPPVMVFPRTHFKNHMLIGAPAGTLGLATPSSWMNAQLFVKVMEHFVKYTSCFKDNPALLIFDNHDSHLSIEALNLAKENGVTILTIPPHSSNKLQPLDVACFKPFKTAYNSSVDSWMIQNPGKTFSIYNVANSVGYAFEKALTPSNIISFFKNTGIYPFDSKVFSDIDFMPSAVTDREVTTPSEMNVDQENVSPVEGIPLKSSSKEDDLLSVNLLPSPAGFISPQQFKRYPKAAARNPTKKSRRRGKSIIATDTPEKNEIADRQKPKVKPQVVKQKKSLKKITKQMDFESDESETTGIVVLEDTDDDFEIEEDSKSLDGARNPVADDYVLVQFKVLGQQRNVFYVGKILNINETEATVKFFRKSGNRFLEPDIEDVTSIDITDIKMVLPKPTLHGHTSRQKASFSFEVDFTSYELR